MKSIDWDGFNEGVTCGVVGSLFFSVVVIVLSLIYAANVHERHARIQQQAVERGYAVWGESTSGTQVFVWKEARVGE